MTRLMTNLTSNTSSGRRIHTLLIIIYVFAVGLIIGIPYYSTLIAPWRQPILQVNDTTFDLAYFTDELQQKIKTGSEDIQEIGILLLQELLDRELIREEALRRGIIVSKTEIEDASAANVKAYHGSEDHSPQLLTAMLSDMGVSEASFFQKLRSDLYKEKLLLDFVKDLPASAAQIHLQAILTQSADKAEEIRQRVKEGEVFSQLAAGESIDLQSARKNGDFGWWPQGVWLKSFIGMIRAEGVLCKTREEARLVRKKILTGEDLAALAGQYSRDETSRPRNGYIGWVSIDRKTGKQLAAASFDLAPGSISPPIDTPDGFWIVHVLEKSPAGNAFDEVFFHQSLGWVSPPLYTKQGHYLLRIADREEERPLSSLHQRILADLEMNKWLLSLARDGSEEGWIKWYWGSNTLGLVMERLALSN